MVWFGKVNLAGKKSLSSSILEKAQRSKIDVQPSSVACRESKNKSKGALPHGVQSSSMVPVKPHIRKIKSLSCRMRWQISKACHYSQEACEI